MHRQKSVDLIIAVASFSIVLAMVMHFVHITHTYKGTMTHTSNIRLYNAKEKHHIRVYISRAAARHLDIAKLRKIGFNVTIVQNITRLTKVEPNSILLLNITDVVNPRVKAWKVLTKLVDLTNKASKRVLIVILNPKRNRHACSQAIGLMYKYYHHYGVNPFIIVDNVKGSKERRVYRISNVVLNSAGIAFSVKPNMLIIINTIHDIAQTLSLLAKWAGYYGKTGGVGSSLGAEDADGIVGIEKFAYIGSVGYITAVFNGTLCHEVTGYMAVKVDYYYANVTVDGRVYHAWLAHVVHSAKGYETSCCYPFPPFCKTYHHYPSLFISKTDWNTLEYPGQILDSYQPVNFGTASTITYTIAWQFGANYGEEAEASIRYSVSVSVSSPGTPYYEWYDISDPPYGIAAVKHYVDLPPGFDVSKLDNVLFTVEPSSIGYLDPTKPGGNLPMIVTHSFYTRLNTGDEANVTLTVILQPSNVVKVGG